MSPWFDLNVCCCREGEDSPLGMPRNTKELQEVMYSKLPQGLTQPVVVRSKVSRRRLHA